MDVLGLLQDRNGTRVDKVVDAGGKVWSRKTASDPQKKSEIIARNGREHAALRIYDLCGVPVPKSWVDSDGTLYKEFISGENAKEGNFGLVDDVKNQLLSTAAVDMFLANWDALFPGNILQDEKGIAYRIDVGGSLDFRAQNGRKDLKNLEAFHEQRSMRDNTNWILFKNYHSLTDADLAAQIEKMIPLREAILSVIPQEIRPTFATRFSAMENWAESINPSIETNAKREAGEATEPKMKQEIGQQIKEMAPLSIEQRDEADVAASFLPKRADLQLDGHAADVIDRILNNFSGQRQAIDKETELSKRIIEELDSYQQAIQRKPRYGASFSKDMREVSKVLKVMPRSGLIHGLKYKYSDQYRRTCQENSINLKYALAGLVLGINSIKKPTSLTSKDGYAESLSSIFENSNLKASEKLWQAKAIINKKHIYESQIKSLLTISQRISDASFSLPRNLPDYAGLRQSIDNVMEASGKTYSVEYPNIGIKFNKDALLDKISVIHKKNIKDLVRSQTDLLSSWKRGWNKESFAAYRKLTEKFELPVLPEFANTHSQAKNVVSGRVWTHGGPLSIMKSILRTGSILSLAAMAGEGVKATRTHNDESNGSMTVGGAKKDFSAESAQRQRIEAHNICFEIDKLYGGGPNRVWEEGGARKFAFYVALSENDMACRGVKWVDNDGAHVLDKGFKYCTDPNPPALGINLREVPFKLIVADANVDELTKLLKEESFLSEQLSKMSESEQKTWLEGHICPLAEGQILSDIKKNVLNGFPPPVSGTLVSVPIKYVTRSNTFESGYQFIPEKNQYELGPSDSQTFDMTSGKRRPNTHFGDLKAPMESAGQPIMVQENTQGLAGQQQYHAFLRNKPRVGPAV